MKKMSNDQTPPTNPKEHLCQIQTCFMCCQVLTPLNTCMVECAAGHILCFQCTNQWVTKGHRQCPACRDPIQRCLQNGAIHQFDKAQDPRERCYICNTFITQRSVYAMSRFNDISQYCGYCQRVTNHRHCQFCGQNPCHLKCLQHQKRFPNRYSQNVSINSSLQYCPECREQPSLIPYYQQDYVILLMRKLEKERQKLDKERTETEQKLRRINEDIVRIDWLQAENQRIRALHLSVDDGMI